MQIAFPGTHWGWFGYDKQLCQTQLRNLLRTNRALRRMPTLLEIFQSGFQTVIWGRRTGLQLPSIWQRLYPSAHLVRSVYSGGRTVQTRARPVCLRVQRHVCGIGASVSGESRVRIPDDTPPHVLMVGLSILQSKNYR